MGIIESVQQYDLNIPAGGAQSIDVTGDRVQFLSAIDPFAQIEIRPNFAQGNITLRPGQGFRFSEPVQRWVVYNRGALPLSGYLLIGSGDFFDQRISGTVDVIDGAKARTLAGIAFNAFVSQPSTASVYSRIQLWNPAGSGRNVVLERIAMLGIADNGAHLRYVTAPLANLMCNGISKKTGGAQSVVEFRADTTPTASLSPDIMVALTYQGSTTKEYVPSEPFYIAPGYGLTLWGTIQNASLGSNFEWYED
ncbi:hypothetical protein OJJOAM_000244 [Cupriavidus sp. H18C1]|uniref:hypothetical protein n=1 Tax=Cupriavidus sp. H18C1 TaxID=3241601 RepID=UPI003BB857FD